MSKRLGVSLGLLVAFAGQLIALALAGAGHGWITPFWASIVLWIAYPLALLRVGKLPLVVMAIAGDAMLMTQTAREGIEYFWKVVRFDGWAVVVLWLAIWLGWQMIVVASLTATRRAPASAADG